MKLADKKVKISTNRGITQISVEGYKSIYDKQIIDIKPLTIIAGANSSGKSSIMQPILMIKQTLDSSYDPGPLLLNGPNVRATTFEQCLSSVINKAIKESFSVSISIGNSRTLRLEFNKENNSICIATMKYKSKTEDITIISKMHRDEIRKLVPNEIQNIFSKLSSSKDGIKIDWKVVRNRCFLEFLPLIKQGRAFRSLPAMSPSDEFISDIKQIIHIPGLRGNPERTYPVTAVGNTFPGTFEKYTASVIAQWQHNNSAKLDAMCRDLKFLGLTWKIAATRINDTQVELKVGRLNHYQKGNNDDLVNIADVGFGLSQVLPILVALHAAIPGQLVYVEQPEIHLHPKAQTLLATVFVNAINRGIKLVVETQSSLLLLGMQALVAEKKISPENIKLHWFNRSYKHGVTKVSSTEFDMIGAFGKWPEDFDDVVLEAQSRYLDAVDAYNQEGACNEK
ncbi:MAG: AAA family ATPase [Geobacteraceae bacterium]|nr:AAA family ATPase [Geobacteraceae bacterium]NTW81263.1 AAA family ATPase [Geobacteraceae bacterium]